MDEIIKKVSKLRGYKMGEKKINILCYADDAVLVAEDENDLQRLLHQFNDIQNTVKMYTRGKWIDHPARDEV